MLVPGPRVAHASSCQVVTPRVPVQKSRLFIHVKSHFPSASFRISPFIIPCTNLLGILLAHKARTLYFNSTLQNSMAETTAPDINPPSPDPEAGVEADDYDDNESSLADLQSSTASISSSIMKFREENGRTYHAYQDGKYLLPNDEREQDRLDLQHHLFTLTFNGKLFTCDVDKGKKEIRRVLDAGCGTGIWAIDFADEHPEAEVLGIDLSPIQPAFLPPNVTFVVDDLEE